KPLDPVLTDMLFEVHVAIMISAYAAFAISFISSLMYILLSREMKSKDLGIFFERLPSLEFFDKLSNQAVNTGLIVVTGGILLGFYMGMNAWEGSWPWDPKLVAVVLSWAIYLVHYVTRKSIGWQGRRAAIVSVIGFNWLLFSFIIVSLFFSKFHRFQ
ncbi:MAG: cytochrome c biogenesis protein CcsA, partial [bacterium]